MLVLAACLADASGATVSRHAASAVFRLVVAADVACPPGEGGTPSDGKANGPDICAQADTAKLIESLAPDAVAAPGDLQYEHGRLSEFNGSFDTTWGAFKDKIYPAPGNHEWYDSPNGQGYFDYFDGLGKAQGRAGVRGHGWYSLDLDRYWHLITLNSNCASDDPLIVAPVGCAPGSAQERWLRADLAAHRGQCLIAQWHHPLFTSGPNQGGPNDLATRSFWHDLYAAGATLVLNGHDHGYERFARQSDAGTRDTRHGVRELVVGTGGKSLFGPGPARAPGSEVYDVSTIGVLLLTLHPHSYTWRFYRDPAVSNGTLADHGNSPCNTPAP